MVQCAYCQAETGMYASGVPICVKCSQSREAKAKEDHNPNVQAILIHQLNEMTIRAQSAAIEFDAIADDIPSSLPHPDGMQRLRNASLDLTLARHEMMKAHNRLNDFLARGIVPEDLKLKRSAGQS